MNQDVAGSGWKVLVVLGPRFNSRFNFHTEALAFDDDRVSMMQQPVQDRGGQAAVIVKDLGPFLEGAVEVSTMAPCS